MCEAMNVAYVELANGPVAPPATCVLRPRLPYRLLPKWAAVRRDGSGAYGRAWTVRGAERKARAVVWADVLAMRTKASR